MADKDDWKQRYREGVREWENGDRLFRKLVGRLALAAEGGSDALDDLLRKIQRDAKEGELALLQQDLDLLGETIKRLDAAAVPQSTTAGGTPAEGAEALQESANRDYCLALLGALDLPSQAQASIHSFRSRLSALDEERCLLETASLLGQLIQAHGSDTASSSNELLRDLMLNLIKEVELAQPGMGSLQTLRETIEKKQQDDWHLVLARVIAEIRRIINRISSDKHALQQLVQEVGQELSDISDVLLEDHASLLGGRRNLAELQSVVQNGVEEIQEQIAGEDDIAKLKGTITASLEGIKEGLSGFIASDETRASEAEERNRQLQERVKKIELEANTLRNQLQSSRDKLLHDTLTAVGSRLAYDEALARELSRFARGGPGFCMAVLDIDHFKRVNDTYGHSAGDKALQLVASIVSQRTRQADDVYRIGGEEFALLLPGTELKEANGVVDALRTAVEESDFHYEGAAVPMTLSAGLTQVTDGDTAALLFDRADDALYRAKQSGRNRVEVR
ncbi:MAG: diguanylate cyclase [Pseudomonadota bacterium]